MGTLKSGSLLKQDGWIFKDWKKKHCALYNDGEFALYEKATDSTAELRIHIRDLKRVVTGTQCGSVNLPTWKDDKNLLFSVETADKTHYLLADSPTECREWVDAVQRARNERGMNPNAPPQFPIGSYPTQSWNPNVVPQNQYQTPYPPQPPFNNQPYIPPYGAGGPPVEAPPPYAPPYAPAPQQYVQQPQPYGQPAYPVQPIYRPPAPQQTTVYNYRQPGQTVYVREERERHSGFGPGGMALGLGGGVVGGLLLGSALSNTYHHDDIEIHEYHHFDDSFDGDIDCDFD